MCTKFDIYVLVQIQVVKVMNMLYVNWNGKFVDTRTRGLTMWHLWLSQFQNKYQDSLNNFSCVMLILNYRIYYNISIYVYHCIYFGIRYYISGKCPCLNKMGGNTTLLEQFQNQISKSQKYAKSIPLIHKYITDHFPDLIQALQQKVTGLN